MDRGDGADKLALSLFPRHVGLTFACVGLNVLAVLS